MFGKKILEYFEFTSNIYAQNQFYNDTVSYLNRYNNGDIEEVRAVLKSGEEIILHSIDNGEYKGKDIEGLDIEGDFIDIDRIIK